MKLISFNKIFKMLIMIVFSLTLFSILSVPKVYAVPAMATVLEPIDRQIIPMYEVWLKWEDSSNEDYYMINVRDITTDSVNGPSVYYNQYVAKNSTYFAIPTSKLIRGHKYRWSLCAYSSSGSKTFSPHREFKIEPGTEDTHLWRIGYASASHIDYFIHAPNCGKDAIVQSAIEEWNGHSSQVYLHRDYSDTTKELGVYESADIPADNAVAITCPGGSGYNYDKYLERTVSYTDIIFYYNLFYGDDNELRKTMIHETGHALSLAHTHGLDSSPNAPVNNGINRTYDDDDDGIDETEVVYLIMNQGFEKSDSHTTVDRDHLRIKWGD